MRINRYVKIKFLFVTLLVGVVKPPNWVRRVALGRLLYLQICAFFVVELTYYVREVKIEEGKKGKSKKRVARGFIKLIFERRV